MPRSAERSTTAGNRAVATIDLDRLAANHRRLIDEAGPAEVAGVVKADGYGLGVEPVARTLWAGGCRRFFVARLEEGVELRSILPEAVIHVFDGVGPGTEGELVAARLIPVINSLSQLDRWRRWASSTGGNQALPTVLHIDTGMLRLGLRPVDVRTLVDRPDLLDGLDVELVMSHLASADDTGSDQSERQLERFLAVRSALPRGRASLANSAGVFRDKQFHVDLVRPGYALYGGNPHPDLAQPNPMQPVVTVEAPVLQVHRAEPGETVGYGASHRFDRPARLATIAVGYADGFLRAGSNRATVFVDDLELPVVGRISMDLVTVDITGSDESVGEGTMVEVIGPNRTVDAVADDAGTIGYEILTSLGGRYQRRYRGGSDHERSSCADQ